jgi:hypothetical protein
MANQYKRFFATEVPASTATITTIPAATTAIVKSVIVSNDHVSTTASVSMLVAPSGTGTLTVEPAKTIQPDSSEDLLSNRGPLVLESADILKIKPSAGDIDVTVSALLVDRN